MSTLPWTPLLVDSEAREITLEWRVRLRVAGSWSTFSASAIVSMPEFSKSLRVTEAPAIAARREGRCSVSVYTASPDDLAQALQSSAEPAVLVLECLADEDWVELFRGIVVEARIESGLITLTAEDGMPGSTRTVCPQAIVGTDAHWLPVVMGEAWCTPVPLFQIAEAKLREALTVASTTIKLDRAVDWATPGTVQIQDEVIVYTTLGTDGRSLEGLTRLDPRVHRAGAWTAHLPGGDLDWGVAGHEAEVTDLRIGGRGGAPLDIEDSMLEGSTDGRTTTIYRRDTLPLGANFSNAEIVALSPLGDEPWTLDIDSSVLDPLHAVEYESPRRGAVFSALRPFFSAVYTSAPGLTNQRFDHILSSALILEYSNTAGWTEDTRLRIRVEKGASGVELIIAREGESLAQPIEATVEIDPNTLTPVSLQERRLLFETVSADGPWVTPQQAVQFPLDQGAVLSTGDEVAFAAGFITELPDISADVRSVRLHVMIRNDAVDDLEGYLAITPDGSSAVTEDFSIPGEGIGAASRLLTVGSGISVADLLGSGASYAAHFPDGGDFELLGMWLEVVVAEVAALPAGGTVSIPVSGGVTLGHTYNAARLDVSSLLPVEDRWDFFTDEGGDLRVTVELIDPPPLTGWSLYVRGLRWEYHLLPASGIRPTAELAARVRGMACREDGTANPAEAIRTLLVHPDFVGLDEEEIDLDSFDGGADLCDGRGLAMACLYNDGRSIGDAIAGIVAESTHALRRAAGKWSLCRGEVRIDDFLLPTIPAEDLGEGFGVLTLLPGVVEKLPVPRTLARGADVLLTRHLADHPPRAVRLAVPVHPHHLTVDVGMAVAVVHAGLRRQGEVREITYRNGELALVLDRVRRVDIAAQWSNASVFSIPSRGVLRFVHAGRCVAELADDGTFSIAGELQFFAGYTDGQLYFFIPSTQQISVGTAEGYGFYLDVDGNLQMELALVEEAEIETPCLDRRGLQDGALAHLGGMPGGAVAMTVSETELRLRGQLVEGASFLP
ncbi:hypothetical protein GC173_13750 [bacterium]|nr:hypothetical protein [bacterium]